MFVDYQTEGTCVRATRSLVKLLIGRGELDSGTVRIRVVGDTEWQPPGALGLRRMEPDQAASYTTFWVLNLVHAGLQAHYAYVNGLAKMAGEPPLPEDLAPIARDLDRVLAWLRTLVRDRRAPFALADGEPAAERDELRAIARRMADFVLPWKRGFAEGATDTMTLLVANRAASTALAVALSAATYAREHLLAGEHAFARLLEPESCAAAWAPLAAQAREAAQDAQVHMRALYGDRSWHPELYVEVYQPLMDAVRALNAELPGLTHEARMMTRLLAPFPP